MRSLEQTHEHQAALESRRQENIYRYELGLDVKRAGRRRLEAGSRRRRLDLEDDLVNFTTTVESFILDFQQHGSENSFAHAQNNSERLLNLILGAEDRARRAAQAATNLTEYLDSQLNACKGSPATPEDLNWNLHGSMWFVFTILTSAPGSGRGVRGKGRSGAG